jgi:RNA polymerase sigma factor for flagellar operon FliA
MISERTAGPEELLLHRERMGYLYDAIEALPDRLKLVVTRYFLEERPMAEVAAELGVTESRVSQLRSEALALLKDGMNTQLNPGALATPERPDGCVARRRAAYFAEVATQGNLKSRLAMTTTLGLPLRRAA